MRIQHAKEWAVAGVLRAESRIRRETSAGRFASFDAVFHLAGEHTGKS